MLFIENDLKLVMFSFSAQQKHKHSLHEESATTSRDNWFMVNKAIGSKEMSSVRSSTLTVSYEAQTHTHTFTHSSVITFRIDKAATEVCYFVISIGTLSWSN